MTQTNNHHNYDFVKNIASSVLETGVRKPPLMENNGPNKGSFTFFNVMRHKGEDYYNNYEIGTHTVTACLTKDDCDRGKIHSFELAGIPKEVKTDFFFNQTSETMSDNDFNSMIEPTISMMFSGKFNKEFNDVPQFIYFLKVSNASSLTASIELLGFVVNQYQIFDSNSLPNVNARCFLHLVCLGEDKIIDNYDGVYIHRSVEDYKNMDYSKYVKKYYICSPQFKTDINILKAIITRVFIGMPNKEIGHSIRYTDNEVLSILVR